MSRFDIQPLQQFSGSSAAIRRPRVHSDCSQRSPEQWRGLIDVQEIACFSYDDKHDFHLDERSLRYYYPPRLGVDLCEGFDSFQQLDDTADDHLDSLLRTIVDLEQKSGSRYEPDFVSWRGMMTKVFAPRK